jgi:hypothetical protein
MEGSRQFGLYGSVISVTSGLRDVENKLYQFPLPFSIKS